MAARIILRIQKSSQRLAFTAACWVASLAALTVFMLIIVWTAELLR